MRPLTGLPSRNALVRMCSLLGAVASSFTVLPQLDGCGPTFLKIKRIRDHPIQLPESVPPSLDCVNLLPKGPYLRQHGYPGEMFYR